MSRESSFGDEKHENYAHTTPRWREKILSVVKTNFLCKTAELCPAVQLHPNKSMAYSRNRRALQLVSIQRFDYYSGFCSLDEIQPQSKQAEPAGMGHPTIELSCASPGGNHSSIELEFTRASHDMMYAVRTHKSPPTFVSG